MGVAFVAACLLGATQQADAVCGNSSLPPPVPEPSRATLIVCESALNKYASAVLPLTRSTPITVTISIPNPFLIPPVIHISFDGTATASVTSIVFDVTAAATNVQADISGHILGFPYNGRVSTTVNTVINPNPEELLVFPGPMFMLPRVEIISGVSINAPFVVNVGASLQVAPIPLDAVVLHLWSPRGTRDVILNADHHALTRHNGYLELKGDVRIR